MGSLTSHIELINTWKVFARRDLRFIVLIREDMKVLPFADVITKVALSTQYFETLSDGPAGVELTTSRVTDRSHLTEPPVRGC